MNESNNAKNESSPSSATSAEIHVDVFGRTDVGLVREHNEDNFLIADLTAGNRNIKPEVRRHVIGEKGSIFVVCDGMGGAAAGEVASQIAVDTIYEMMQNGDCPKSEEALAQRLDIAISEAGRRIHSTAKANRTQRGMGTTVTAAALMDERLLVGQVGDSRAYILRGRQFVQITKDQSLAQQLIDAKQMTEEEARSFDKNNIILQALGTAEEVHVDMTSVVLKAGDRLVICSDGLCGLVENEAIGASVYEAENPLEACRLLTEQACEAGGYDNITVIVASFDGEALKTTLSEDDIDETLIYDQYAFSRETEATGSHLRPQQDDGDDDFFDEDDDYEDTMMMPPESVGVNRSLVGAVVAILLIIVVVFVYLFLMGREDAAAIPSPNMKSSIPPQAIANPPAALPAIKPATPATAAPVPTPAPPVPAAPVPAAPVPAAPVPAAPEAPAAVPSAVPSPVNTAVSPSPDSPPATPHPVPEVKEKAPESTDAPQLAPTPEEAITKSDDTKKKPAKHSSHKKAPKEPSPEKDDAFFNVREPTEADQPSKQKKVPNVKFKGNPFEKKAPTHEDTSHNINPQWKSTSPSAIHGDTYS